MKIEDLEKQTETVMYSMPNVEKGKKLKKVWTVAEPILRILSNSFFIPKKFRLVLAVVIEGVDELLEEKESEEKTAL